MCVSVGAVSVEGVCSVWKRCVSLGAVSVEVVCVSVGAVCVFVCVSRCSVCRTGSGSL